MATQARARRSSSVATALILLSGTTGCGLLRGDPPPMLPVNAPANAKALEGIHEQEPEWVPCEENAKLQCAEVTVPLNYADPGGDTIVIAVNRLPRTGKGPKLGSLVILPDRLGASGRAFLFSGGGASKGSLTKLRESYDLVSFDPRGVGASGQVTCLDDKEQDSFYQTDFTPDTDREKSQALAAVKSYAEKCNERTDDVLPYVGIENISRDLDILRVALKAKRLNYLSWAGGTLVGQRYAAQYPDRVGRIVLDSVEFSDPEKNGAGTRPAASVDEALTRIFEACVTSVEAPCPIGGTTKEATKAYDDLLARLDAKPVTALNGRRLTESLARIAAIGAAQDPVRFGPILTMGIAEARKGHGQFLLSITDTYLRRGPDGVYASDTASAYAMKCLAGEAPPQQKGDAEADTEQAAAVQQQKLMTKVDAAVTQAAQESPRFGPVTTYLGAPCVAWPVPPTTTGRVEVRTATASPVVLVNQSGNPMSPLATAREVASKITGARLIISNSDKSYGHGNACVDGVVNAFLLEGEAKAGRLKCP